MKARKLTGNEEDIEIQFSGITLLSEEEYIADQGIIPSNGEWWWWLRSPDNVPPYVAFVKPGGYVRYMACDVGLMCVRPALYILNTKTAKLEREDRFEMAGRRWTVLSNDLAICDDPVGQTCFKEFDGVETTNDYDKSDVKKWLHDWAEKEGIWFTMETFSPD